ncbi:MAG: hypothetical protein JWR09_2560 [Mucilaginibacter sp.]|nr:hypothetical protein [Mucilaginibacter sp.]
MKAPVYRGLFPFSVGCVPTANHHANRKCISLEQYKIQKRANGIKLVNIRYEYDGNVLVVESPGKPGLIPLPVGCVPTANHHANRKCISLEQYKIQKRANDIKLINIRYGYGGNVLVVGCEDTANGERR